MQFFDLASLPNDLLGHLLSTRHRSHWVLRLWKCGNHRLNNKLAACISLIFLSAKTGSLPARRSNANKFPSILFNLRALRSLSIKVDKHLFEDPLKWQPTLVNLPSTLQELSISSYCSKGALANHAPTSVHREVKLLPRDTPLGVSYFIPLDEYVPALNTLEIEGSPMSFLHDSFIGLPSTLTHLTLPMRLSPTALTNLKDLPSSLRYLDGFVEWQHQSIRDLPNCWPEATLPQLERLVVPAETPNQYWLPRTLTEAEISKNWNFKNARSWPPLVQSLTISYLQADTFLNADTLWSKELPPRLTSFTMKYYLPLFPADLALLPRSITSLNLSSLQWTEYEDLNFPPELQQLRLPYRYDADEALFLFRSVPRSLKLLQIDSFAHTDTIADLMICRKA